MGMGGGTNGAVFRYSKEGKRLGLLNSCSRDSRKVRGETVRDLTVRVVRDINDRSQHIESKVYCLNRDSPWSLYIDFNKNNTKPLVMQE